MKITLNRKNNNLLGDNQWERERERENVTLSICV